MRQLTIEEQRWPLASAFAISRGSKTAAEVLQVSLSEGGSTGRGECVPYLRYGETPSSVTAQINSIRNQLEQGCSQQQLQQLLPAGAARNAVDCALWDLQAKQSRTAVWQLAGLVAPQSVITAYTLSMDSAEKMALNAELHRDYPLLKLKLGPDNAAECVRAVRQAAPDSRIIVDANEAWTISQLKAVLDSFEQDKVEMIEQPLPADADAALASLESAIPIGADESCHTRETLHKLTDRYQVINIKLDKTGGLSEAIRMQAEAVEQGLDVMIGCMVATSLAMAPAMLLAGQVRFVDLDGPLLMAKDREHGLRYESGQVFPPEPMLWG